MEDLIRDMFALRLAELEQHNVPKQYLSNERRQQLFDSSFRLRGETATRSKELNKYISENPVDFSKISDDCKTLTQDLRQHIVFTSRYLVQLSIFEDVTDDRQTHFENTLNKHKSTCPKEVKLNDFGQLLFNSVWRTPSLKETIK